MRIKILQRADELKPAMIELAQAIHSEPELSGQEHHASQRHVNLLLQNGFQVEYPFAGCPTAFKILVSVSHPAPVFTQKNLHCAPRQIMPMYRRLLQQRSWL